MAKATSIGDFGTPSRGFGTRCLRFNKCGYPPPRPRLASGWGLAFAGRQSNPLDCFKRFPLLLLRASFFPKLTLAQLFRLDTRLSDYPRPLGQLALDVGRELRRALECRLEPSVVQLFAHIR